MSNIVRLAALKISNIKNVREGRIVMPNAHKRPASDIRAEVLGLYGQNGSGKTAVVDALYYLQRIMIGESLDEEIADYIDVNEKQAEMNADLRCAISCFLESVNMEWKL